MSAGLPQGSASTLGQLPDHRLAEGPLRAAMAGLRCDARLDHVGISVASIADTIASLQVLSGIEVLFALPFDDAALRPQRRAPGEAPTAPVRAQPSDGGGELAGRDFALTMLACGSGHLELLEWKSAPESLSPTDPASIRGAHVALEVADVRAAAAALVSAGAAPVRRAVTFDTGPTPGLTSVFVRTSTGLLLELVNWSAP